MGYLTELNGGFRLDVTSTPNAGAPKAKRPRKPKATLSLHGEIEQQFNPANGPFADRTMRVRVYRLWMDIEHSADENLMKKAFIMSIANGAFTAEERTDILAALYAGV